MSSEKWEVDPLTGCWNWLLHRSRDGYGRVAVAGRRKAAAHRVAYEETYGPIPEGMTVDHLCFNPACVNPAHLRLMTHVENVRNQRSAYKTHCKNGHEFTPENTYIRPRVRGGGVRQCRACNSEAVRKYRERKAA